MDTVGKNIKLTLFGASHAPEVGFTLTGIEAGLRVDMDELKLHIARRSPKHNIGSTPRREADEPTVLSGISDGRTDGSRIEMRFPNRAYDRSEYRPVARPSHADFAAYTASGGREDISGGGRYSGRMTLPLTAAGSICRMALKKRGIEVFSHLLRMGEIEDAPFDPMMRETPELDPFFPLVDPSRREAMEKLIAETRAKGDTLSCEAEVAVTGLPVGLGAPLFDGVEGVTSKLLFMIPGLRGVKFGSVGVFGSTTNDSFTEGGRTLTNNSGGVNGGLTNGMPLVFRVEFRPVPSIALPQTGYDLIEKKPVPLEIKGRHDTAILPRGLVAVEAAAAIALLDLVYEREEPETLSELRGRLDSTDAELMRLFAERMELSEAIGGFKRMNGVPTEDRNREGEVYVSRTAPLPERFRAGGVRLIKLLIEESKNVQRSARNLYLVGMPDSGKTRMGKELFKLTGLPVSDTDKLIMTRAGRTIDEIFAESGEEAFREMETGWLRTLAKRGGLIVATGGGIPMRRENVEIMKGSGVVVFLDRKLSALHGQKTANRPLIRGASPDEVDRNIDRLYHERHDKYAEIADLIVDPDEDGAAEKVLEFFLENR